MSESSGKRSLPVAALAVGVPSIVVLAALPFVQVGDGADVPRLALFLGRFHPSVLHFPVAFLVLALLLELFRLPVIRWLVPDLPEAAGRVVLWLAAWSALAAAVAGWLLAHEGGYDPDLLDRHLWSGVATGIGAFIAALLRSCAAACPEKACRRKFSVLVLAVVCGIMGFAAHAGGGLTHGEDFLTEHAPDAVRRTLGLPVKRDRSQEPLKPVEERLAFADVVFPILESRCITCHDEGKKKGGLRVDAHAEVRKGGKTGPKEFFHRIHLPVEDKKHMPPKGKAQLTPEEIAVLDWWGKAGSPDAAALGGLDVPAEVRAAIEAQIPESDRLKLEERKRQETARYEAALTELRKTLPGSLRVILPGSRELEFTAAIAGKSFSDAELAKLAAVGRDLAILDLSRTGITDAGLKAAAAGMPNLKRLDLRGTAVGDEGMKALSGLAKLEALGLYGTGVTDAGLEPLRGLKTLRKLYLADTKTTGAGQKKLAEARPELSIVP